MITDYQAHLLPRSYFEGIVDRSDYPRCRREGDGYQFEPAPNEHWWITPEHVEIDIHLDTMDQAGIDAMVSSPGVICDVARLDLSEAAETVAQANEESARVQRLHPERFTGLAMLPLQDTEAALKELNRSIEELGLRGVCMLSNVGGQPLVTPQRLPVFERLNELGVPLFLHPANTSAGFAPALGSVVEVGMTWMWDTSVAALSLITSGVLDACDRLTVVHPHLGGVLPYVIGRVGNVDRMAASTYDPGGPAPRPDPCNQLPVAEYLKERFYVDVVAVTPGAMSLAAQAYGHSRILFATDYPWLPARSRLIEYVRSELPENEAEAVLHNFLPGLHP